MSEVKKSDDDLCRCMHRNSSRPYDLVFLLKNMSQGEQSECVCVCCDICAYHLFMLCVHMVTQSVCVALLFQSKYY